MALTETMPPLKVFTEDLFKPIFSAAWVGLMMGAFEGLPKSKRIALFFLIVLVGVAYMTRKRLEDDE